MPYKHSTRIVERREYYTRFLTEDQRERFAGWNGSGEKIEAGAAMKCHVKQRPHQYSPFETYPTTHFFSNGKLLLTREGVVEPAELAALIADHLLK